MYTVLHKMFTVGWTALSILTCPVPTAPQWTTFLPMFCRISWASGNLESGPPTIKVRRACLAAFTPVGKDGHKFWLFMYIIFRGRTWMILHLVTNYIFMNLYLFNKISLNQIRFSIRSYIMYILWRCLWFPYTCCTCLFLLLV